MNELITKIEQWGADKGIISGGSLHGQMGKLYEEFHELHYGFHRNDHEAIKDGIGDCCVVLILMAKLSGYENPEISGLFTPTSSMLPSHEDDCIAEISITLHLIHLHIKIINILDFGTANWTIGCLNSMAKGNGLTIEKCLQHAYDTISKRTGKMVDGTFVKDQL
jgi:hypothetical protein